MHAKKRSSGLAAVTAILMVAVGVAAGWLAVAPAIFGGAGSAFDGSVVQAQVVEVPSDQLVAATPLAAGVRVTSNIQVSQPRDPFRPLIDDTQLLGPGDGTVTGIGVLLLSVSDTFPLEALVAVNGIEYTVRVGDTFAGVFKVISLTPPDKDAEDGDPLANGYGVFLFGDNAFDLTVGQQILK